MDRPQDYPVKGQEDVTDKVSAFRRVHISVVRKEPQYHEEAQEWWLLQVKTELQAAISAAVMAISGVCKFTGQWERIGQRECICGKARCIMAICCVYLKI